MIYNYIYKDEMLYYVYDTIIIYYINVDNI